MNVIERIIRHKLCKIKNYEWNLSCHREGAEKVGEDGIVDNSYYYYYYYFWETNTMNSVNDHSKPNQSNSSQN